MGEAGCVASDHGYSARPLMAPPPSFHVGAKARSLCRLCVLRDGAVDFAAGKDMRDGSCAKARIARVDVIRRGPRKGAIRRGGRVAEGARLESVFTGNRNVGSNPTPSASPQSQVLMD